MAVKNIFDDLHNTLSIARAGIKGTLKSLIKAQTNAKKLTAGKRAPKKQARDGGMIKRKPQPKKLPGKKPTDPTVLARSVVETARGKPLSSRKSPKKKPSRRKAKR